MKQDASRRPGRRQLCFENHRLRGRRLEHPHGDLRAARNGDRLDAGELAPAGYASLKPGAGPRHLAFHPRGDRAYVINELDLTMTAYAYDATTGLLRELQVLPTLPAAADKVGASGADVHVHRTGRFLYGSNRGHDSIAIFAVDERTGALEPAGWESVRGSKPRFFGPDPDWSHLYAANQDTDNIVRFEIDQETGKLSSTGDSTECPMPVCLKFLPIT